MPSFASRFAISGFAGMAAAAMIAGAAMAQDYPTGPITMVVPFSAGGPTDTVARIIGEQMGASLGREIIVKNVAGAGGTLGATEVANAAPDGYNVLLHHIGMSTAPALYATLPYDPVTSFAPVGLVTNVPMTIIARKDFEPDTLAELIDYTRANADTVLLANAGLGAASHLCGLLFMNSLGVELTEVPYQGTGPAMTDILGSQVDLMCDQTTNTTGQINGGEVKAYAVTTPERLAALPDLPTTIEGGLPDMQVGVWHGIYAPAGTPEDVVAKLTAALQQALANPDVAARFAELGTAPVTAEEATPAAHAAYLADQLALWKPIIEAAGVTPQ